MSEAAPVAAPAAPVAPPPAAPAGSGPAPAQNLAETAPATPKGNETTPDTPDQAEKRGTSRFERKIGRLHREAAEAKAERDLLRKQLDEVRKPAASPDDKAPTLAQFDYDPEKYADAKAEYAKKQAVKEHETKQRTESVRQEHQRLSARWEETVERGSEKYDDFEEKVGRIQPGTPFTDAIIEAENSEDVAHYLGSHPEEIKRIVQLSPRQQIREIGKLEAKLLATPQKPQTPSKAPAPIAPLAGNSAPSNDAPSEKDDMRTWIRKRNKQVHGR